MALILLAGLGAALLTVALFPVVGIAMIPVVAAALLALVGWVVVVARRGPGGLPERTTSPDEPDRLGTADE